MENKNYTVYHLHDDTSNANGYADSTTKFEEYIKLAKKQGMKAIAFSNHGGIYDWVKKKQSCDKAGIKYIHGCELYLCNKLEDNNRGWHIGLYAKNLEGVKELNSLISISTSKGVKEDKSDRHFYFNPRISMKELMKTSDNIIITTACLASPLWKLSYKKPLEEDNVELYNNNIKIRDEFLEFLGRNNHRCFLEIQYHNCEHQIEYNKMLLEWSNKYNIPLIAGTDTHSSNEYKAECRKVLQKSKNSFYGEEDEFDLVWKTYDELVKRFEEQNSLPMKVILQAIENTNVLADMVEEFTLDKSFKYPNLYGDNAKTIWWNYIIKKLKHKKDNGIIDISRMEEYKAAVKEEFIAMTNQGMESFMMFMAELVDYCRSQNINSSPCRGSVGGSVIAYITDIIDVDPIKWKTVFSRFCNADRISLADIDIDFNPSDRAKVYEYIINRFGNDKVSYILTLGTIKDRGSIDVLAKGLDYKDLDVVKNIKNEFDRIFGEYSKIIQEEVNIEELEGAESSSPSFEDHHLYINQIRNIQKVGMINKLKEEWDTLRQENQDLFYYFDGIKGTIISKGIHPAGMIGSPITLFNNLGVFYRDGDINTPVSFCSMKAVDSLNYVKFDILGLKTIGVIQDTYKLLGKQWEYAHEIDWNDDNVWEDMITSPVGVFQFEGSYAYDLLSQFKPRAINDMSLVNASLRPSGKSYRDRLINREFNKNPSSQIDELLKENNGFLVFQEDTIKFLSNICGFSGSHADNVRRCIGKKDVESLKLELPKILDGYCAKSDKPREIAEKEAKEFVQIISDSSEYQFGFNHSTGYSMNGYMAARLRYYYPLEFTTAYLNRADNEEDINSGTELAKAKGIKINPPKFRYSQSEYTCDRETNSIYKGLNSIKYLNEECANFLYSLKHNEYSSFIDLIHHIKTNSNINFKQLKILTALNFFSEFGKNGKLMDVLGLYETKLKNKNLKDTTKAKRLEELKTVELETKDKGLSVKEQIKNETEYLGYADTTYPNLPKGIYIIIEIDDKYTPKLKLYNLKDGTVEMMKCYKNDIKLNPFGEFSVIKVKEAIKKNKSKNVNGKWVKTDEKELQLTDWEVVI